MSLYLTRRFEIMWGSGSSSVCLGKDVKLTFLRINKPYAQNIQFSMEEGLVQTKILSRLWPNVSNLKVTYCTYKVPPTIWRTIFPYVFFVQKEHVNKILYIYIYTLIDDYETKSFMPTVYLLCKCTAPFFLPHPPPQFSIFLPPPAPHPADE